MAVPDGASDTIASGELNNGVHVPKKWRDGTERPLRDMGTKPSTPRGYVNNRSNITVVVPVIFHTALGIG